MKRIWNAGWYLIKNSVTEFVKDNGFTLSASLSYYTIFSLPALLIIIISVFDYFLGPDIVKTEFFNQIRGVVGNATATEIENIVRDVRLSTNHTFATIVGLVVLLIGATGIFSEIQSSINYIWAIKAKPKRGLVKFLKNRLMSFTMIGSVSFLLLVGLVINTLTDFMYDHLTHYFHGATVYLFYLVNVASIFLITTILFVTTFKILPDGTISIKDSAIGALFTSFLFMTGKFAIGAYIGGSHIASAYGAMGSIILILVWVYYSSIILYFGAEFTKVYANRHGKKITPNEYSVTVSK
jgi:membrane protein